MVEKIKKWSFKVKFTFWASLMLQFIRNKKERSDIVIYLIETIITLFIQILAFLYLYLLEKDVVKVTIGRSIFRMIPILFMTIFLSVDMQLKHVPVLQFTSRMTIYQILFCVAMVDYVKKIIPNLLLLIGGTVEIVYRLYLSANAMYEFLSCIFLITLSFLSMLLIASLIYLLFKGTIGYGDVKLCSYLCLCMGYSKSVTVIFFSLILSALYSVGVVLSKKKSLRAEISFAPFVLIAYFLLLFTEK